MLHRLPIFPLDVVLFPGVPLPLHVFEPRYRQMLRDCQAGGRRFGLVLPDRPDSPAPEPGAVGCVAEIRTEQQLSDGRSNLVVVGGPRFTLDHYLPDPAPYLVASVSEFGDRPDTDPAPADVLAVTTAFRRYWTTLQALEDADAEPPELPSDPEPLSFRIAGALRAEPARKQPLLATRSTAARFSLLRRLIEALTLEAEQHRRVHERARGNGSGT